MLTVFNFGSDEKLSVALSVCSSCANLFGVATNLFLAYRSDTFGTCLQTLACHLDRPVIRTDNRDTLS